MKIFKDKRQRSWSLQMYYVDNDVMISAVDSDTGEVIAGIIRFSKGEVCILPHVKTYLENGGYDPFEHDNMYDTKGAIHICHIHLPGGRDE